MTKQFYAFVEHNDHEGETWNFYVELTPEEHAHLSSLIKKFESEVECYEIDGPIAEHYVRTLVEYGDDGGYMPAHQMVEPTTPILDLDFDDVDEYEDAFYKGQFWEVIS